MPPRLPLVPCLRAPRCLSTFPLLRYPSESIVASVPSSQFTLPLRPFSSSPLNLAKASAKPRKRVSHDPYIVAQRNRKKAANLSRRAELEEARVASLGDPVRGNTTPFVQSFSSATPLEYPEGSKIPKDTRHLNYALNPHIVAKQLEKSEKLAVPLSERIEQSAATTPAYPWSSNVKYGNKASQVEVEPEDPEAKKQKDHARATEAIARITALENGSSKDRMRVNIARCIETFGRHQTDRILPPRAPPLSSIGSTEANPIRPETNIEATKKRIGPDTGSSEVQIAILTAKIKTLADFLQTRGKGDKHNKRNLRLLVHRRQKLLQYLRKKERGGPRWQHCIETLGLTEGTWKGEISL